MVRAWPPVYSKLLLRVVVNRDLDNSVGYFTHKDIEMQPTGIREFVFDKQFKKSISIVNYGIELWPNSLVDVEVQSVLSLVTIIHKTVFTLVCLLEDLEW